jgi:hypothetical protein
MENWRQFSSLEKLDEDYKQFCETYDRYIVLNESNQEAFLLEEGAFSNIIDFFKDLASEVGTQWKALVQLFKSNDGILWKILKSIGWSLDSLSVVFDSAFKAIKVIQQSIFDFAQDNPITGLKGQQLTDWLKAYMQDSDLKNLTKFAIAGILIAALFYSLLQADPAPFNPTLILTALAGNFTAMELIEEGWFSKILFSMAAGVALNAAFPGISILTIGALGLIRKLLGLYKFGKFGAKIVKGKRSKDKPNEEPVPEAV